MKPGSLFPALHRMEEAGWLTSFWGESENNRRAKFYWLTAHRQRQLESEPHPWWKLTVAVAAGFEAT